MRLSIVNLLIVFYFHFSLFCPDAKSADKVYTLNDYYVYGLNYGSNFTTKIDSDHIHKNGIFDLNSFSRYLINVDLPFDFGSSDGLVPYLGSGTSSVNIRGIEGNRVSILLNGVPQVEGFSSYSWDQSSSSPGGIGRNFFDPAMYENIRINKNSSNEISCPLGFTGSLNFDHSITRNYLSDISPEFISRLSFNGVNNSYSSYLEYFKTFNDFSIRSKLSLRKGEETQNNGIIASNPLDFKSISSYLCLEKNFSNHLLKLDLDFYDFSTDINLDSAENTYLSNHKVFMADDKRRLYSSISVSPRDKEISFAPHKTKFFFQQSESSVFNIQQGKPEGHTQFIRDREQTNFVEVSSYGFQLLNKALPFDTNNTSSGYLIHFKNDEIQSDFTRIDKVPSFTTSNLIGFNPSSVYNLSLSPFIVYSFGENQKYFINIRPEFTDYSVKPRYSADYLNRLNELNSEHDITINNPSIYENTNFAYSFELGKSISPTSKVSCYFGKAERNPSAEDLSMIFSHGIQFVLVPNPELASEKSESFEISFNNKSEDYEININAFYNIFKDFIEPNYIIRSADISDPFNPISAIHQPRNIGKVHIHGLELSFKRNFNAEDSLNHFSLGCSFGRSIGRNRTTNDWLKTIDPFKYIIALKHNNKRHGISNELTLLGNGSKTQNSDTNIPNTKSFVVLDYAGSIRIDDSSSINFGVKNLLNKSYYKWSTIRRAVGHGNVFSDRLTEPGRHFFLSFLTQF